jgi:2-C-methyl-D-erythritol 4-phosphate cytidylyltransferase
VSAIVPSLCVIVVAAGRSTRFGGPVKKSFVELAGRAVFLHSLETFRRFAGTRQLLLALAAADIDEVRRRYGPQLDRLRVDRLVPGGAERRDTVANCLAHVSPECELVAVHDAARPLTTLETIEAVVRAAGETGAAIAAERAVATIKRAKPDGTIEATLPRDNIWLAQTPQVFRRDLLLSAYAAAGSAPVTDDAELVERTGRPVRLVASVGPNWKVTTPEDLALAEARLAAVPAAGGPA